MNLLHKIRELMPRSVTGGKDSRITRNFIISIAVIYSILILICAGSLHYTAKKSSTLLRETLFENNKDLVYYNLENIGHSLMSGKSASFKEIYHALKKAVASKKNILAAILFTRTGDENYFRVRDIFTGGRSFNLKLSKNDTVKEENVTAYLKKGLLYTTLEPKIYSGNGMTWQNLYYPFKVKRHHAVIQFLFNASHIERALNNYNSGMSFLRRLTAILIIFLVLSVVAVTLVFTYNYSLLISNLSLYMKKAARGDLDINLNTTDDRELNELALSFNTLIEELKVKSEQVEREPGPLADLFKTGVSLLKEGRPADAIPLFIALVHLKPEGFGSYFNLGVAYAKTREYGRSLEMFTRAHEINPAFEMTMKYVEKIKKLQDA